MKYIFSLLLIVFAVSCNSNSSTVNETDSTKTSQDLTKYIDPLIGSDYHGHVFVGASVPWGAVQVGPTQIPKGWDWCSGYHYSDSILIGFSQLHLSGTGIGDLGDVMLMPYTGKLHTQPRTQEDSTTGYGSRFSHDQERAEAGYYYVKLLDNNIDVHLTSSERVGYHKYVFPKQKDTPRVALDLVQGIGWDQVQEAKIIKTNDYTITGYRYSKGWAPDQRVYFAIRTSIPIKEFVVHDSTEIKGTNTLTARKVRGTLTFDTNIDSLEIKVGISPVSEQNALENINSEINEWNFANVVNRAKRKWFEAISKITIETDSEADKRIFYTAMYHSMIAPVLFNDNNKSYWGTDKKIYNKATFNNYSIFSLWDTYRTLHPLMNIIASEKTPDFINSMIAIFEQQGRLPMWHLMGNETNTMVGHPAIPVIADAILKDMKGFDVEKAYQAMVVTANIDSFGSKYVRDMGFIPAEKEIESVAKALEYAISDMSIARAAKKLGKEEDYNKYFERGNYYKKYFDSTSGFMRGVLSNGQFRTPFNPFHSTHRADDYTEGNAWQYTWLVPQDVYGLVDLFGSKERFISHLDSLFIVKGDMGEDASPDISGLIGMYAHGNEPNHHIPYLYAYVGQQWKTAEKIRQITKDFYTDKPDGLIGNDDCGQMSAWYVMSALGFYPVNPAGGAYVFGSPHYKRATMKMANGRSLFIEAKNTSQENIYIQSVTLNGKDYNKSFITWKELQEGGKLVFAMGNTPNKQFGLEKIVD